MSSQTEGSSLHFSVKGKAVPGSGRRGGHQGCLYLVPVGQLGQGARLVHASHRGLVDPGLTQGAHGRGQGEDPGLIHS